LKAKCRDNDIERQPLQINHPNPAMIVDDRVQLLKTRHEAERKEAERKRKAGDREPKYDGPRRNEDRHGTTARDGTQVREATSTPKQRRRAAIIKATKMQIAVLR
jgi:hypothetical protein